MGNVATVVDEANKLSDQERVEFLGEFVAKQNVLWLSQAVKALEDKFGVKAAAGGGVVVAAGPAPAEAKKEEAQSSFDVVLKSAGAQKINVIKIIREVTTLGLKEAKDLADKGGPVKQGVPKEEGDALVKKLKDAGAEVELK